MGVAKEVNLRSHQHAEQQQEGDPDEHHQQANAILIPSVVLVEMRVVSLH